MIALKAKRQLRACDRVACLLIACSLLWAAGCGAHINANAKDALDTAIPAADEKPLSGKLVITGSSTVAPLAAEVGSQFEKRHPLVRIDVQTGGSSRGIADARSGVADIGMASRGLKESEQDLLAHPIARDEIVLIVHATNPLANVTVARVAEIYQGRVGDWKEIGGEAGEIVVVHKAAGRATRDVFLNYFELEDGDVAADLIVGDNQQGIKTVAGNPLAIGYVSAGSAAVEMERGASLKVLPICGEAGGDSTPIARPLNLVTRNEPAGLAKAFIEFARSEAGAAIVERLSFVPLGD